MNPMALLFALLAGAGAISSMAGGRGRNVDRGDDQNDDDDDGSNSGGARETPEYDNVTIPTPPVQTGGTGEDGGSVAPTAITGQKVSLMSGRMATLDPQDDDIASIRIVNQPGQGHVSVNPDNTFAVVMTDTKATGSMSFTYEITHGDGTKSLHTTPLEVSQGLQQDGWGTGDTHYMLATDANDRVIVEKGDSHRAVYVSNADRALTIAEIAAREGVSVNQINGSWLAARPQYGTEGQPLAQDAGAMLWRTLTPESSQRSCSLLLERGYTYDKLGRLVNAYASGASELQPLYIGAWGTGDKPEIVQNDQLIGGSKNVVIQDVHFTRGLTVLESGNVLLDNVTFTQKSLVVITTEGFTARNSEFYDIFREEPTSASGLWEAGRDKLQGIYTSNVNGLLLEGNFFDMVGWEQDYRVDGSIEGGQPPSMFSHDMYIDHNNLDVTLRHDRHARRILGGTSPVGRVHRRQRLPRQQRGPELPRRDVRIAGPDGELLVGVR
jgi:hypothetical protein